ncbi:MAG: insulinase family protein [Acidobacteria bacterium]|nr:MAG: insulinase family protein [Acidobacteriota bacterium]MCE7956657.1 insulinase family protein [Acidobacteria bacterium ACB2]
MPRTSPVARRLPGLALPAVLLALLVTAPASPLMAGAPADSLLPFPVVQKTLPNGLKVIVVPTGLPDLVSLQIPVRTGSRNEVEPGKSGFAHFFEHMMFRGTKAYPPEAYQAVITRAGARQNAYTTDDYTNYHVTFAKEDLEKILEIEADRFRNLSYPEAAFKTEARAVLGEYNKNSANPIAQLEETQRDAAFTTHTYKHTTMGFLRDIEEMPNQFEYSRLFFDRWYRPEYATLIVAGDVEAEKVLPLVEKYWGGWQRGSYTVEVPREPEPKGPVTAHVAWKTPTLPWVTVAFHGPAFSETEKDFAAVDLLFELYFGETSPLYKRLVQDEQKLDSLFTDVSPSADPGLVGAWARLKKAEDALYVRDALLSTFAEARVKLVDPERLVDAQSNARYSLVRSLDNTERIAGVLARYVRHRGAFETLDAYYRVYASVTPEDVRAAARKVFTDSRLVLTTLAKDPLPEAVKTLPAIASLEPKAAPADVPTIVQKSALPLLNVKLSFAAGSAHDPKGKEGLAALAASMVAEAGSRDRKIDEIQKALFPMAGVFRVLVDKELTTFTGVVHRDNAAAFLDLVLPQLLDPGYREEDFRRLKDAQQNALLVDLVDANEEELGKERLQELIFAGTPYAHPVLGTKAGIEAITLEDVKAFVARAYTKGALTLGVAGDVSDERLAALKEALGRLPDGPGLPAPQGVSGRKPKGLALDVVKKETRATAISLGHPIEVTRSHPDFAALSVARSFLGEHRSSSSHLYQVIRETRGMNYGDYAYIEAFPRGMFQFTPDPNIPRRAQIFEVWIRPVTPENGPMALKLALHELKRLVEKGMTKAEFEATRDYLTKNVFVQTATQDQRLGSAIDSRWYGVGDYAPTMRERLGKLTLADVNRAIKKHLSWRDLQVVAVTKDAEGLRDKLLSAAPATIRYDAPKPKEVLDADARVGAEKLGLSPQAVTITPAEEVFSR